MPRETKGPPKHETLKAKERDRRDTIPEPLGLRVHRAISWLGHAERESQDPDVRFILLWVGFNALYGTRIPRGGKKAGAGRIQGLLRAAGEARCRRLHFRRDLGALRARDQGVLANKYVFAPFREFHNGVPGFEDWERWFDASGARVSNALARQDTVAILSGVFDRLYVLRNQLAHGGATWRGGVNRNQVRDGAAVLGWMLPLFVDIMMDTPMDDWGLADDPVVE